MAGKRIVLLRSNPVEPDPPVEKVAATLRAEGYEVTILAWDRSASYTERTETSSVGVKTVRFGIPAEYGGGWKRNLFPLLTFQRRLWNRLNRYADEIDAVHAFDLDTGFTAARFARQRRKRFVYHVLDYYADSHALPKMLGKFVKREENKVISSADVTILCTEKRREQIAGARVKKLVVIHNTPIHSADGEDADILQKEGGRDATNHEDRLKIAYVGILAGGRLLPELLQVVAENRELELHVGGFGGLEGTVKRYAETYGNIFWYGKLPYGETLALERACDVMTAIYDPSVPNHRYAAPNKFYEALLLGKPLIMARGTGFDEIPEKEGIGVGIEYGAEGLRTGLRALNARRAEFGEIGKRARALYEREYSWRIMSARLLEAYEGLWKEESICKREKRTGIRPLSVS